MKKKIKSLYFTLLLILINFHNVYAATGATIKDFTGKEPTGEALDKVKDIGQMFITVATTIGSIISVVVLIVIGIKYMLGSAEERADYKKTLLPYFIGAILVFAASSIAGIVYNFATSL